jgi:hypothetical protein
VGRTTEGSRGRGGGGTVADRGGGGAAAGRGEEQTPAVGEDAPRLWRGGPAVEGGASREKVEARAKSLPVPIPCFSE